MSGREWRSVRVAIRGRSKFSDQPPEGVKPMDDAVTLGIVKGLTCDAARGLAVTRGIGLDGDRYCVTIMTTGLCAPRMQFDTMDEAKGAALKLAECGNWERGPYTMIRDKEFADKVRATVKDILADADAGVLA